MTVKPCFLSQKTDSRYFLGRPAACLYSPGRQPARFAGRDQRQPVGEQPNGIAPPLAERQGAANNGSISGQVALSRRMQRAQPVLGDPVEIVFRDGRGERLLPLQVSTHVTQIFAAQGAGVIFGMALQEDKTAV